MEHPGLPFGVLFCTLLAAAAAVGASQDQASVPGVAIANDADGIASQYPGDAGIEADPNVVFVERFDEPTVAALIGRWTDVLRPESLSFGPDVPAGSPLSQSLIVSWVGGGVNDGGHLYREFDTPVTDMLYVRYYIKYPSNLNYTHTGVWMGGYNPPLPYPFPHAGEKPAGDDRFSASAETNTPTRYFDQYDYWMAMHLSQDGNYWGNVLMNNPNVVPLTDQWMCVEHMVKLNTPSMFDGEHALWINGVKVSHLGPGFPNGNWLGGNFTQNPNGPPFEGFEWRMTADLNLNWIWLQVYAPNAPPGFSSTVKFGHLVAAKSYIGCLAPRSQER